MSDEIFSGELFNQIFIGEYYTISDENDLHNGLKLFEGSNEFPNFNIKRNILEGLEFINSDQLLEFISIYPKSTTYWDIIIPSDAIIITSDDIFMTNKCILTNKKNICDMEIWTNIEYCINYIKKYKNNKKKISLVRFMVNRDYDDEILKYYPAGLIYMDEEKQTDELCLDCLERYPKLLRYLGNKTTDFYKKALSIQPKCFDDIPDDVLNRDLFMIALKHDGLLLENIQNQDLEMCEIAVEQNPLALEFAEIQTPNMCYDAIKKHPKIIKHIEDQTIDLCYLALELDPFTIKNIRELTSDMCEFAMKSNIKVLKHIPVEFQTLEMCTKAVAGDYRLLEYAKYQTEQMCLDVVKKYPKMLFDVIDQTDKICMEAIKKNIDCIKYVKKMTVEIFLTAISINEYAMNYISSSDEQDECCVMAALINPKCIDYMSYHMRQKCTNILLTLGLTKFQEKNDDNFYGYNLF